METERHKKQMELLIQSLQPWLNQRQRGYVNGNMFIYYSPKQIRSQDFKGPDVFVVADAVPGERKSWVVWHEGKRPDVVIELLSETTAAYDKGAKKTVYQNELKAPEYFWFDPFDPAQFTGFRLVKGVYKKLRVREGRLLSRSLGLTLSLWDGLYQGIQTTWLRWATPTGELLLLPEEAAEQRAQAAEQWAQTETQRAQTEAQRAQVEAQRAQAEAQRAQVAEQRAQTAEAEIARLKALLNQQM